jgi:hypothetical protein
MSVSPQRFGTEGQGSDPYAEWDAAYVLGALAPAERLEFEGHLAGCGRCRASVAEIAGLPGLLAQVGPEDAAALTEVPDPHDGIPPTVMPEVLATVRRERGRLTRALIGLAAAVVLVLAGLGLGQVLGGPGDEPLQLAFTPVAPTFITANVSLVPVGSGTDVRVECQYSGATDPDPNDRYAHYSIVVTDRSGHSTAIKDWPISAHKVMRPSGTTPLPLSQIRAVEIRETATNETVLRAQPG